MKAILFAFLILASSFSASNASAQTANSFWTLNSTTQTAGNKAGTYAAFLTVPPQTLSPGSDPAIEIVDYTMNGQRLRPVSQSFWTAGAEDPTRFIQFDVNVSASITFSELSFNYGASGSDDQIASNAYYSIDNGANWVLLNQTPLSYPGVGMASFSATNLNEVVLPGGKFSLRIHPYAVQSSNPMMPIQFAVHDAVVIQGNPVLLTLGGRKFNDSNGNHKWDGSAEDWLPPLPPVTIVATLQADPTFTWSTTTNPSGLYSMTVPSGGMVIVNEISPVGFAQTYPDPLTGNATYDIAISASNLDFGNQADPVLGQICGVKFNDGNGNGDQDDGDVGLQGWEINLTSSTGTTSMQTDADGSYCFDDLPAGSYELNETPQDDWAQTFPEAPGSHTVPLTSGQNVADINFGNQATITLGGRKFNDIDGDGVNDGASEEWNIPLPQVTIVATLQGTTSSWSAQTNDFGHFTMTVPAGGPYEVSELPVTGYTQTHPTDLLGNPTTHTVSTSNPNLLFGNQPIGSVTGKKFNDTNGNGVFNVGEEWVPPLPTVTFTALLVGTTTSETATSDPSGNYSFTLTAGDWVISETSPTGYAQTSPTSDNGTYPVTVTVGSTSTGNDFGNQRVDVCIAPPPDMVGWWRGNSDPNDFSGYQNDGSLQGGAAYAIGKVTDAFALPTVGDYVTVPDSPELNFGAGQNFSMDMWVKTTDAADWTNAFFTNNPVILHKMSPFTNAGYSGFILSVVFGHVNFGMYSGQALTKNSIHQIDDGNWHFVAVTVDRSGGAGGGKIYIDNNPPELFNPGLVQGSLANNSPLVIGQKVPTTLGSRHAFGGLIDEVELFNRALTPEEIASIYAAGSAGKCKDATGTIEGTKFNDLNGNGVRDMPDDIGMLGITINAVSNNGNGTFTATTISDGTYTLPLAPDTYTVSEAPVTGYNQTKPANNGGYTVTVGPGVIVPDLDFGNQRVDVCIAPPPDMVGWWSGDSGSSDLSPYGNNGSLQTQTGTASYGTGKVSGAFSLPSKGDYVHVNDAPSLNFGAGEDFSMDVWVKHTNGSSWYNNYFNKPGIIYKGYGPGYLLSIMFGQAKFEMSDGNGYAGRSSTPRIDDGNWHFIAVTVDRDGGPQGGKIFIDNYPPEYFDPSSQSGSLVNSKPLNLGNSPTGSIFYQAAFGGLIDEAELFSRALTDVEVASIYLAGSAGKCKNGTGTVTGKKFNDINGNGQYDGPAEDWTGAVPAVFITASSTGPAQFAQVDATGNYSFSLTPGQYWLTEGAVVGYHQTSPANGGTHSLTVGPGVVYPGNDFGNQADTTGTVSGHKFEDLNGDGRHDLEKEPWLAGITIQAVSTNLTPQTTTTVTTASDGSYSFSLAPGTYVISEDLTGTLFSQTFPPNSGTYTVVVTLGGVSPDNDFGNELVTTGTIEGTKFIDNNGDGVQNGLDIGKAGVLIQRWWGLNVVQTAVTDGSGHYSFTNVPPGTYVIREVVPAGYLQTSPSGGIYTETLVAGQTISNRDFGNRLIRFVAGECIAPPLGLRYWGPGDDHASDISGNANHGTLQGSANYASGEVGNAFNLTDISDFVAIPNSPSLNFGDRQDFTIEAWVRTTGSGHVTIVDKRTLASDGSHSGYSLFISDGRLAFQMGDGAAFANPYITNAAPINDGTWYFVGVTVQRGMERGLKVYINNTVVQTFNPIPRAGDLTNTSPLYIGRNALGGIAGFGGQIDEVEIFDRALSEPEMRSIFDAGEYGKCKDGVGTAGGTVFTDINNNGVPDPEEPGVIGIKIGVLLGDVLVDETTTDVNGHYSFEVAPGTYTFFVVDTDGHTQTSPDGKGTYTEIFGPGSSLGTLNFGFQVEPVECMAPLPGLLGWWPFDNYANDLSGNENHGNLQSPLSYVPGMVAEAFSVPPLFGNSLWAEDAPELNFGAGQDFTIGAWVKLSGSDYTFTLVSKIQASLGYFLYSIDGGFVFVLNDGGQSMIDSGNATLFNDNLWHFVAVSVDRDSNAGLRMYVDNQPVMIGSPASSQGDLTNTGIFWMGGASSLDPPTSALLDEVMIFNRALSEEEIRSIYDIGAAGQCKGGTGTIAGTVFSDPNRNGIREMPMDLGVAGVQVQLVYQSGSLFATQTSDVNGMYLFDGVPPGSYTLGVIVPGGSVQTAPLGGTYSVMVGPGDNMSGLDFGNYAVATGLDDFPDGLPAEYALKVNYPNPFNPSTRIEYALPEVRHVRLDVFDMLGRLVTTLIDSVQLPGQYGVTFDAGRLPSGVYLYRMTAGSFVQTNRMLLMK